jgi:D-alanyl-D-alanine carboxypeptidase
MVQILDKSFKRAKPADIQTQLASARSRIRVIPKSLQTPIAAPKSLPVAPPPRTTNSASIDVALAGEAAYLDGGTPVDDADGQLTELPTSWSVQVGSFARRVNAHKAAAQARRAARDVLGKIPARLTMVTRGNIPLWRVRFHNLDETQARSACAVLFSEGRPCVAIAETG